MKEQQYIDFAIQRKIPFSYSIIKNFDREDLIYTILSIESYFSDNPEEEKVLFKTNIKLQKEIEYYKKTVFELRKKIKLIEEKTKESF